MMINFRNLAEQAINKLWYSKANILSVCLLPFSWVFIAVSFCRRKIYTLTASEAALPVIIIGNITVGGTGKTPLLIKLTKILQAKGYRVGVISRGYGVKIDKPTLLKNTHTAQQVGDEAIEIFSQTHVPVMVGANRAQSVSALAQQTDCNIVLSDDGLQHYKLKRKIEIVVVDGLRQFGNGFCLPAGPLREKKSRLDSVDFVVSHSKKMASMYSMHIKPLHFVNVSDPTKTLSLVEARNKTWCVVSAIANPEKFIRTLDSAKIMHKQLRFFPDHHRFLQEDIDFGAGQCIIMTNKDAVKCHGFSSDNHWYLAYDVELEQSFLDKLLSQVEEEVRI